MVILQGLEHCRPLAYTWLACLRKSPDDSELRRKIISDGVIAVIERGLLEEKY